MHACRKSRLSIYEETILSLAESRQSQHETEKMGKEGVSHQNTVNSTWEIRACLSSLCKSFLSIILGWEVNDTRGQTQ